MKYSRQILILMFINLIIAFLLIFIGNNSRKIELSNLNLEKKIDQLKQKIEINKIEYTFHTNSNYLRKIYKIYHSNSDYNEENKIITYNELLEDNKSEIFLVDY